MARKPQMTAAQMEQIAQEYRAEGYDAQVTQTGRHVIAIKVQEWARKMNPAA